MAAAQTSLGWKSSGAETVTKPLEVVVMYTGAQTTLAGLRIAGQFAENLQGKIRLLVPNIVPYPLPLEDPPAPRKFTERALRALTEHSAVEISVDIRLCRDVDAALAPVSLVVVAGRRRWWPTRAVRLAKALRRRGHHVLFTRSQ